MHGATIKIHTVCLFSVYDWRETHREIDRQCLRNVTLWHVCVSVIIMEMPQCVPIVLWMYVFCCQGCNIYWKHCYGNNNAFYLLLYYHVTANNVKHIGSPCKVLDIFFWF